MTFDFSVSTLKKAVRVFGYAFVAVYPIPAIIGAASGSQPLDTHALRAAAVAGIAGLVAYAWNAIVDPSPIPSLKP